LQSSDDDVMQCDVVTVTPPDAQAGAVVSCSSEPSHPPDLPHIDFKALAAQLPNLASLDTVHVTLQQQNVFQSGDSTQQLQAIAQSAEERAQQLEKHVQGRFEAGNKAIQDVFKNVAGFCAAIMKNQQAVQGQQQEIHSFLQVLLQKFTEVCQVMTHHKHTLGNMLTWQSTVETNMNRV
jgi:hypothetical protein